MLLLNIDDDDDDNDETERIVPLELAAAVVVARPIIIEDERYCREDVDVTIRCIVLYITFLLYFEYISCYDSDAKMQSLKVVEEKVVVFL